MTRRNFLKVASTAALGTAAALRAADVTASQVAAFQKPVFNLHKFFSSPVKIASIELLQAHNQYFLRTRSTDGVEGIVQTKDMDDYIPILSHRVIPHFLGKDARDLETPGRRSLRRQLQLQARRPGLLVPGGLRRTEPVRPDGQDAQEVSAAN